MKKIIEQKVFMFPDLDALLNRRDWMSPAKPPAHSNKFKSCSQENTQQEKEQVAFNYNKRVSASNKPACPKHYPFLKDRLCHTTSSCIIPFTKQDTQTQPPRFLLTLLFHHPMHSILLWWYRKSKNNSSHFLHIRKNKYKELEYCKKKNLSPPEHIFTPNERWSIGKTNQTSSKNKTQQNKQWDRHEDITLWMTAAYKQETCIAMFNVLLVWLRQKRQEKKLALRDLESLISI